MSSFSFFVYCTILLILGSDQIGGLTERIIDFGGIQVNAGEFYPIDNMTMLEEELGFEVIPYDWDSWEVRNDQGENITSAANSRYYDIDEVWNGTYTVRKKRMKNGHSGRQT